MLIIILVSSFICAVLKLSFINQRGEMRMTKGRRRNSSQEIQECVNFRNVLKHCTYNSIIAFDIDNTILRPTKVEDLGSDQWFKKILQRESEKNPQRPQTLQSAIKLHQHIQKLITVKPVEPEIPRIIKILQDLKLTTLIVTARKYSFADVTFRQLNDAGMNFSQDEHEESFEFTMNGRRVVYSQGVLFCDGANKGLCLIEYLKRKLSAVSDVVMLDDSMDNLENVREVMRANNFNFHGLRYSQLDDRVSRFDLQRANAKLSDYSLFFSKSVANIVKEFDLDDRKTASVQDNAIDLHESRLQRAT